PPASRARDGVGARDRRRRGGGRVLPPARSHRRVQGEPAARLRGPRRPPAVRDRRAAAAGDLVGLPDRLPLLLPRGVPRARVDSQRAARPGRRLAGDPVPGNTRRRRHEAGPDRLPVPRPGDLQVASARVQRRHEHRRHRREPRDGARRDRADGKDALVQAAASTLAARARAARVVGFASVYPLVTARAVAREFTYEVDDGVGVGAIVRIPFGRSRARGIVVARVDEAPTGFDVRPVEAVIGEIPPALVELALWIADYYGSTPARALALVAPESPKRRK